jgi:hypothetical protein
MVMDRLDLQTIRKQDKPVNFPHIGVPHRRTSGFVECKYSVQHAQDGVEDWMEFLTRL